MVNIDRKLLFALVCVTVILAIGYWIARLENKRINQEYELYQKENFAPTVTDEELKEINEAEFAPKL
jgi:hypothetical protein